MSLSEKDCYKKGLLWGVTIFTILDVSKKINSLDDALDWLNIMNKLAEDTDKTSKKDDRGMKLIRKEIGNKKLISGNFKTFPQLINLVAMLNRIKKGSQKAWVGRTKQPGFQKSLDAVKQRVIGQICKTILDLPENCSSWKNFYSDFFGKLITLLKGMQNTLVDESKALTTLCKELDKGLSNDISKNYKCADMTLEDYNKASNWINSTFKDSWGDELANVLLKCLSRFVKKMCLNFSDLKLKIGTMNDKINGINEFINYIKKQSADINKNGDVWDDNDKKLVKSLNDCFKTYGVSESYTTPKLKNNKFYIITDLWKLISFIRIISNKLFYYISDTSNTSFQRLARFLSSEYIEHTQWLCANHICKSDENYPQSIIKLFNYVYQSLSNQSYDYSITTNDKIIYDLKRNIDDFKQKFKDEINDFISNNALTEEEYNNCLFPFLNKMNCYFDNTPILKELNINTTNGEITYKY